MKDFLFKFFICLLLLYAAGAFINMSLNPVEWGTTSRVFVVVLTFLSLKVAAK